jgi:hypothetical protein
MSTLGKRLTALEQISEEIRLRPFRETARKMAQREGFTREETEAAVQSADRYAAERDALLRAGKTPSEVIAIFAVRMGMSVEELEQRCAEIIETYG